MPLLKEKDGKLDVGHGHRLYWASYGHPSDPAVLLIHGIGGYVFDPARMDCFDGLPYRVIALHRRGCGLSTPPGGLNHNTIPDNIDDIEKLRHHLSIDRWSVLSWSYGATLMAGYAMLCPGQCERLISYAPYLGAEEDYDGFKTRLSPDLVKRYYAYHNATDAKGLAASAFNKAADPKARFEDYYMDHVVSGDVITRKALRASKTPAEWKKTYKMRRLSSTLEYELQVQHPRLLETMRRVFTRAASAPAPVLIYGGRDAWSAPNAYTDRVFPDKTTIVVPDGTHDVNGACVQKVLHNILKC
jgi:proline iminopeptidase